MNYDPHGRLARCEPEFVSRLKQVLADMEHRGHPMVVTDGFRTTGQQKALYSLGRTRPGKVVTNCDGVRNRSRHQDGVAADCAFVDAEGHVTWVGPWAVFANVAQWYGLVPGAHWKTFPDRPHVELAKEEG